MTRKRKWTTAAVIALVSLTVTAAVIAIQNRSVLVETALVEGRTVIRTVLASGIFAAETEQEIAARDPVIIKEVLVRPGDMVQLGQALATVDMGPLEAEQQAIHAELAAVLTQLAILENTLPSQRAQAESQLAAADHKLERMELEAAAMADLYQANAIAELDYRRFATALEESRAEQQSAQSQIAQIQAQGALLGQYEKQIAALESRRRLLGEKMTFYQMKAPVAGQIAEVYVDAETLAPMGEALFLINADSLLIRAEVLAQDAPDLVVGQRVLVRGEVLADQELTGTLCAIHPQATEKLSELGVVQRRVLIEVSLDNEPVNMRPGYPVEVEIAVARFTGLAVPREAVFTFNGQDSVFIIKNDRAILTTVDCGLEGEDHIGILTGLKVGDVVIINPPKETADGGKVKTK